MNLIRWQQPAFSNWPRFGRLSELRNEIDRLFEAPLDELVRGSQVFSGWTPALDMHENNESIVVRAEVPGMKKEEMEVSLHDGSLSISGERKADRKFEDAEVYRAERFVGRFQRTIALPSPVSADRITAQYKDGILTITLPKTEDAKPKQISVQEG